MKKRRNEKEYALMKDSKTAFTLAEVLITLVIIGVIGALTVPSLIQSTQKQEYVSGLKKAYSTLSQAAQQIIAEEGGPESSSESAKDGWAYDNESVYKMFKKHLNVVKDCGTGSGCFDDLFNGKYRYLNGEYHPNLWNWKAVNPRYTMILADGTIVFFRMYTPLCNAGYGRDSICGRIYIDINGKKGPNQAGRDLFNLILTETGIKVPCVDSLEDCTLSDAATCSCNVITENAMNY